MYLTDGSKIKYVFYGQVYSGRKNINGLFFDYTKAYNSTHPEKKITIHPSYFATRASRGTVIMVSVIIAAAITLLAFLKPEVIPVSLCAVFMFYAVVFGSGLTYRHQMKALGLR